MAKCLFCPRAANSVEHLWPEWLLALLDVAETEVDFYVRDQPPFKNWKQRKGKPTGITRRYLCEKCNNTWLSDLENRAKPVFTPILEHKPTTLDASDVTTLATWLAKMALLFDAAPRGKRYKPFFTQEDCLWFKAHLAPLPNMMITLGEIVPVNHVLMAMSNPLAVEPISDEGIGLKPHGNNWQFVFGHVVALVHCIRGVKPNATDQSIRIEIKFDDPMLWLWPRLPQHPQFRWPPNRKARSLDKISKEVREMRQSQPPMP